VQFFSEQFLCYSVVCVSCAVIKMMDIMFQSGEYVNSTLEVYGILNLSLTV